ncbi:MAG: 4-(cytidine 5'-diphospho)-2-C-methyl-D-erythritol kinase [Acidiferrobacteraceae bacterium]
MTVWPAPAKVNLFLHVIGRRADGYHLLQTVFQFLDFGDELRFLPTADGVIRHAAVPAGLEAEDLCVRAAQRLQERSGCHQGVEITLVKRIPLGAGLGGGSSDAATTLLALNRLWGLEWPLARLAEIGLALGADIPVFVQGHAAWAEGVGERLTPIELPCPWFVVLVPPAHVSTAEIFSDPGLTRNTPPITIRDFHAGRAGNDLAAVVRRRYPQVDQAFSWLGQFGEVRMTGSGASVFLTVATEREAHAIVARSPAGCFAFVASGLNEHPIHRHYNVVADWGVAKR